MVDVVSDGVVAADVGVFDARVIVVELHFDILLIDCAAEVTVLLLFCIDLFIGVCCVCVMLLFRHPHQHFRFKGGLSLFYYGGSQPSVASSGRRDSCPKAQKHNRCR